MIKNMKVRTKLLSAFTLMILVLVMAGIVAVFFSGKVADHGVEVGEKLAPLSDAAMEIKLAATQAHLQLEEIMSGDTNEDISEVWELLDLSAWYANVIVKGGENEEGKFYPSADPAVLAKIREVKSLLTKFIQTARQRYENKDRDGVGSEADQTFDAAFEDFIRLADEAEELIHDGMDQGLAELKEKEFWATFWTMVFSLAGIIIAAILGFIITRSITIPLAKCVELANNMARGEFTATLKLDRRDEMGMLAAALDQLVLSISEIIKKIKSSAVGVNQFTEDIFSGSTELSGRTNEQAASLTKTSSTVEEFATILRESSKNLEETSGTLETFNGELQDKKTLIADVTGTMNEISDSSRKIDNIVAVINDISFQTNLLALNAAVEAARAGEAGRGFAVVASEVRNLAQKTAESSKSIQEIVSQNVASTGKGMDLIKQTSEFFETVMNKLGQMSGKLRQVADGSHEQSTGVDQINQAIMQLENVVNQNAALVDRFTEISKSLNAGTDELVKLVAHFEIGDGEAAGTEPGVSSRPGKPGPAEVEKGGGDFFSEDEGGFDEF